MSAENRLARIVVGEFCGNQAFGRSPALDPLFQRSDNIVLSALG
jgi:hypothetical protein